MSGDPLPVTYVPLSATNLVEGQVFPIDFRVRPSSHDKTVSELFSSVCRRPAHEEAYRRLLPSELWAMARALSACFGRLNELVLARTAWMIQDTVDPDAPLRARTVMSRVRRGRRPICTTSTETRDEAGALLLSAEDDVLLMHDCPKPFFVERPSVSPPPPAETRYRNEHRVYCRYEWDPAIWVNNIHTDAYARACGFEKGLPEFPVYMDWVYHAAVQADWITGPPFSIALHKILPIYIGELVDVVAYEEEGALRVRFIRDGMDRLVATVTAGAALPAPRRRGAQRESVA
jgi:hypothetical protein